MIWNDKSIVTFTVGSTRFLCIIQELLRNTGGDAEKDHVTYRLIKLIFTRANDYLDKLQTRLWYCKKDYLTLFIITMFSIPNLLYCNPFTNPSNHIIKSQSLSFLNFYIIKNKISLLIHTIQIYLLWVR